MILKVKLEGNVEGINKVLALIDKENLNVNYGVVEIGV